MTHHGETVGRWVVLDVGETIIEESRIWRAWAEELGIPQMTFMSVFGAIVARGQGYHHITDYIPVEDWRAHRDAVEERVGGFAGEDLGHLARHVDALLGHRGHGGGLTVLPGAEPAERTSARSPARWVR